MNFSYASVWFYLLAFNLLGSQVHALFHITEEALATSQRLLKEIEEGTNFITENDFNNKLDVLYKIAESFKTKGDPWKSYQFPSITYINNLDSCISTSKINNESLPLLGNLDRFSKLTGLTGTIISKTQLYKHSKKPQRPRLSELTSAVFPAFAENKYNLSVKTETYGSSDYLRLYMQDVYKDIYELLFFVDEESQQSVFSYLINLSDEKVNNKTNMDIGCREIPHQQRMFNLLRHLAVSEAYFFVKNQYFMAFLEVHSKGRRFLNPKDLRALDLMTASWDEDRISVMKKYQATFADRSYKVYNSFKFALLPLSRAIHDPHEEIDESEYLNLYEFDAYIVNEVDLNPDGTCKKTCSDYQRVERIYSCFDKDSICSVHRQCTGKLWNCKSIEEPLWVCPEKPGYGYRYSYMRAKNYSYSEYSCTRGIKRIDSWGRGFYKCAYCQCECTDADSINYFSLRPTVSNIYDNYVIVNVKLMRKKRVIYIVASEAKLLPDAQIDEIAVREIPIQEINVEDADVAAGDFQAITGDARTIVLDELESPTDHLLTGLRLKFVDGYFKLEIRMTEYNQLIGKLHPEKSIWYSKDTVLNEKNKINLEDFTADPDESMRTDGHVSFTSGSITEKHYYGQHTLPYLDLRYKSKDMLLAGAGFILRKLEDAVLGLKLISANVAPHLRQEINFLLQDCTCNVM